MKTLCVFVCVGGGGGRVGRGRGRREADKPKLLIKRKSMKFNLNSQRGGVGGDCVGDLLCKNGYCEN